MDRPALERLIFAYADRAGVGRPALHYEEARATLIVAFFERPTEAFRASLLAAVREAAPITHRDRAH